LLFVTRDAHTLDAATFHIFDPQTRGETLIKGNGLNFGSNIGAPRSSGEAYTDFVESEGPNELVLVTAYPGARNRIVLDIANKTVRSSEYNEFSNEGIVTNRILYRGSAN
jgi:hypothetical protein